MKKILFILLAFISLQINAQTWVLIKKLDSGGAFKIGTLTIDEEHNKTTAQVQSYEDYISILQGTNPITSTYIQLEGIFTNKHDILLNIINLIASSTTSSPAAIQVVEKFNDNSLPLNSILLFVGSIIVLAINSAMFLFYKKNNFFNK